MSEKNAMRSTKRTAADIKKFERISLDSEQQKLLKNKLAEILRPLRAQIGLSQAEIARILGIARYTYSNIETRRNEMTWTHFLAIVCFYSQNQKTKEMLNIFEILSPELKYWFNFSR